MLIHKQMSFSYRQSEGRAEEDGKRLTGKRKSNADKRPTENTDAGMKRLKKIHKRGMFSYTEPLKHDIDT